jgi:hypothetical protein
MTIVESVERIRRVREYNYKELTSSLVWYLALSRLRENQDAAREDGSIRVNLPQSCDS